MSNFIKTGSQLRLLATTLTHALRRADLTVEHDESKTVGLLEQLMLDRVRNTHGLASLDSVLYPVEEAFKVLIRPEALLELHDSIVRRPRPFVDAIRQVRQTYALDIFDAKVVVEVIRTLFFRELAVALPGNTLLRSYHAHG